MGPQRYECSGSIAEHRGASCAVRSSTRAARSTLPRDARTHRRRAACRNGHSATKWPSSLARRAVPAGRQRESGAVGRSSEAIVDVSAARTAAIGIEPNRLIWERPVPLAGHAPRRPGSPGPPRQDYGEGPCLSSGASPRSAGEMGRQHLFSFARRWFHQPRCPRGEGRDQRSSKRRWILDRGDASGGESFPRLPNPPSGWRPMGGPDEA